MGILQKRNEPCSKEHLEKADMLIQSAHTYAITTYDSMSKEIPELVAIADSNLLTLWEYLTTIACVGTAFMEIVDTVSDKNQLGVAYAIQKKLDDWDSGSYEGMVNFINYTNKLVDTEIEVPD